MLRLTKHREEKAMTASTYKTDLRQKLRSMRELKEQEQKKNPVAIDHNNNHVAKIDLWSDWDDELDLNEPLSDGTWGGFRPSPDKNTLTAILHSPEKKCNPTFQRAQQAPCKEQNREDSDEALKPLPYLQASDSQQKLNLLKEPYGQGSNFYTFKNDDKHLSTASSSAPQIFQNASQIPSKKRKREDSDMDEVIKPPSKRIRLLED